MTRKARSAAKLPRAGCSFIHSLITPVLELGIEQSLRTLFLSVAFSLIAKLVKNRVTAVPALDLLLKQPAMLRRWPGMCNEGLGEKPGLILKPSVTL